MFRERYKNSTIRTIAEHIPYPSIYSQKRGEIYHLRVWQGGYKVDTTPLNRRGNSCLRSPHAERFAGSCGDPNIDGLFSIFLFQILSWIAILKGQHEIKSCF